MRVESQVPPVQRTYYEELFKSADLDRDGEIGVTDAAFFRKSMLPNETLGEIWMLSDVKNGKLDIDDFIVALKLISLAQLGAPISLDSIRMMPVVPPPKLQEVAPMPFDWVQHWNTVTQGARVVDSTGRANHPRGHIQQESTERQSQWNASKVDL
ncbi:EPS15 domain-containing protein [Heterostelium album PN500]|uniref:EPS15 domain-containing protein n=1 Tax=Heterostelium pallidum (strain ATCC 26659 / Pp 5 / PN500) TaxID=670386 RepID=D3AZA7_HETP5|nr:EPS15 domain-containing protein [Heterostelium album PN500]EFA85490.1 EPS15 domain-containing protein [Heterostelium album PN500]|eukprot:XP_020437598.1 EPS15 domain-containing protein [Heterostelium album PN500]